MFLVLKRAQNLKKRLNRRLISVAVFLFAGTLFGQSLYEIGDPTDEEQLFVELINRARADAAVEAQRLANTEDAETLGLTGLETFDIDVPEDLQPRQRITVKASSTP